MRAKFQFLGDTFELLPLRRDTPLVIGIDDLECTVARHKENADEWQQFIIDGRPVEAAVGCNGDDIYIQIDGEVWQVQAINPIEAAAAGGGGATAVLAPMPGVVVAVHVAPGDAVVAGQTLIVIESMKLQTSITADRDGVIGSVCFQADETFDKGAELMRFETAAEE